MITLLTCHPYGFNEKRYLLYCRREIIRAVALVDFFIKATASFVISCLETVRKSL